MDNDLRLLSMQRISVFADHLHGRSNVAASLLESSVASIAAKIGVIPNPQDSYIRRIDEALPWTIANIRWGRHRSLVLERANENIGLFSPTAQCPQCRSYRTTTPSTYMRASTRSHKCLKCTAKFKTAMAEVDQPAATKSSLIRKFLTKKDGVMVEQVYQVKKKRYIEHAGQRLSVAQWAAETGLSRRTIVSRLQAGWSPDRILTAPVRQYHGTIKRVADQSVREYPWLRKSKRKHLVRGHLTMVGHPFRYWTEQASKPVTGAVFHCAACDGHSVMIISNVLKSETTCGCGRIVHGCGTGDELPTYKRWQHLLTRAKRGETVEPSWARKRSGILSFIEDLGLMPGPDYYLCMRFERLGWVRGNCYWKRDVPGVFASSADDSWQLRSGFLQQVGATMKGTNKWAVYYCSLCDRHVIESRARVIKLQHSRCEQCRDAGRHIEWNGQRHTVAEWARISGLPATVIYDRLRYEWTPERILTTPQKPYRNNTSHRIDSDAMEGT